MMTAPQAQAAVAEVLLADGFRRTSLPPAAVSRARLRERLWRAALGQPESVREGLRALWSWENVTALAVSPWFAGVLRDSAGSRRALQRRLRVLGTRPSPLRDLAAKPFGTPARIAGRARAVRPSGRPFKYSSHIWVNGEMTTDNVRFLVEEGHDFLVEDETGQAVRVIAAGGMLLGEGGRPGGTIDHGDPIEVLGFVDRLIDPDAPAGSRHPRGEPLVLALRSGDELPLILLKTIET
jgi:hypothetical protein